MSRTALELIGQAGLGYSFDPLVSDSPDEFTLAVKSFAYVLPIMRSPIYIVTLTQPIFPWGFAVLLLPR